MKQFLKPSLEKIIRSLVLFVPVNFGIYKLI